jgi:predicted RNase H-like nuclease (RuvC/YqgF family)
MRKNMLKVLAVIMSLSLLVACGKESTDDLDPQQGNITELEERIATLEADNAELKEENDALKAEIEILKSEEPAEEPVDEDPMVEEEEELPIFGAEEDGTMIQASTIVVKTDEPLINKMTMLGDELGDKVFNGLTMEAVEIKVEDGKDILYVDLKEGSGEVGAASWVYDYFQGSTGGQVTETALVETFLQREYGGIWIDGVHFTLDGESIQYDHVPNLKETILR